MGGVDRLDQHVHDYPTTRKRGKKYYKKMFHHILDLSIWNAFVLYKKNGGTKTNLEFRKCLAEDIIKKFHCTQKKAGRPSLQPGPLRLTERHFPEYIPATEKKAAPTRRCAICGNKRDARGKKIRKEMRSYCKECNMGLCTIPCFEVYHTKRDL